MKNSNTLLKTTTMWVALLVMLTGLAGCGEKEKPKTQICLVLLIIPVNCGTGTSTPPPALGATTPAPGTVSESGTSSTGGSSSGTRKAVINQMFEFEQNDSLDNANVVQFLTASPENSVGINIVASVRETDDPSDFFIFTPQRSGRYGIYICADTCDEFLATDAVYIMLYDQYQTTIASTPVGTNADQMLSAELTAGLAYYVEVQGYNTGPAIHEYQLALID